MNRDNNVVEQLNRLLAFELTSIDQYTSHSRQYEDMGLMKLYERINHEIDDERGHADLLIRRILFLEGKPKMDAREPHTIGSDVREMLENDLQLEYNNAKTLREVIEYCEEVDDYVTREMLVGILKDTEEDHAYWLQIQLNLMDRLGEQLYLQSMM
ncbi:MULTISPECIES: bacterioferritin [Idiomarina]|jgi:bacterioferritin|uniref:Bacterioferritin n=1 Tax=Idiomarina abyssalis TaxID=86102 RepID=A0A8I1GAI8_9GAMM|nr:MULTISPECIES: bacterioferritin [Idiomarina]RDX34554.1 bacterioferritin [Idiomarina sp. HD9-110m-PIT-SAG05]KPD22198.1 bacterioferritin [Idiomarina abyssalis]MAL84196.1 bacterioferritin [Idiomarina sp.]MAO67557.1 bacterioferritin [Idiomarina sp.]MBE91993.1 bacterioferritin [Idiomarina sp.]|tara:strand:- start:99 stop:566 length:468 start_codon:yes stop_codon:yes gene_type:complete